MTESQRTEIKELKDKIQALRTRIVDLAEDLSGDVHDTDARNELREASACLNGASDHLQSALGEEFL